MFMKNFIVLLADFNIGKYRESRISSYHCITNKHTCVELTVNVISLLKNT